MIEHIVTLYILIVSKEWEIRKKNETFPFELLKDFWVPFFSDISIRECDYNSERIIHLTIYLSKRFHWAVGSEVQVAFTKSKSWDTENKVTITVALRDSDKCPRGVNMVKVTHVKRHLTEHSVLSIISI